LDFGIYLVEIWKNRVKRGDFDMVLEENLDMDL
jgi:hypothetical protein